jgi:hypothetical protein
MPATVRITQPSPSKNPVADAHIPFGFSCTTRVHYVREIYVDDVYVGRCWKIASGLAVQNTTLEMMDLTFSTLTDLRAYFSK